MKLFVLIGEWRMGNFPYPSRRKAIKVSRILITLIWYNRILMDHFGVFVQKDEKPVVSPGWQLVKWVLNKNYCFYLQL